MAYADQQMSSNRIIALIIVALIHVGVGYVFVTGLAYEAIQKAVERVTTVDVDEPEPEPEEEPPPPEEVPETVPPPFVPPPQQSLNPDAQKKVTPKEIPDNTEVDKRPTTKTCSDGSVVGVNVACGPPTKTCPDGKVIPQNAVCPEPKKEPEKPKFTPKGASARNSPGGWVTVDDYRTSWINRDYTGSVSFRLNIGADGKVSGCTVTGGDAPSALKDATCRLIERRARFTAATNSDGNPVPDTYTNTVRWQIPE